MSRDIGEPVTYGAVLIALGAMLFASKGIFAKLLFERGMTVEGLPTLRRLIALPVFWTWGCIRSGGRLLAHPREPLIAAAIAGFLCYCVGTLLDFHALTLIDASLEPVVLFSYPALLVLVVSLRDRKRPASSTVAGVLLAYVGIVLAATGLRSDILRQNALGTLLVLACAATFATYFLLSERCTRCIGSVPFTVVSATALSVFGSMMPSRAGPTTGITSCSANSVFCEFTRT